MQLYVSNIYTYQRVSACKNTQIIELLLQGLVSHVFWNWNVCEVMVDLLHRA